MNCAATRPAKPSRSATPTTAMTITVVRMRRGATSVTSAVHRQQAADVPADPKMIRSRARMGTADAIVPFVTQEQCPYSVTAADSGWDVRAVAIRVLAKPTAHDRKQAPGKALYLLALPGTEQQDLRWQGALVAHALLGKPGRGTAAQYLAEPRFRAPCTKIYEIEGRVVASRGPADVARAFRPRLSRRVTCQQLELTTSLASHS